MSQRIGALRRFLSSQNTPSRMVHCLRALESAEAAVPKAPPDCGPPTAGLRGLSTLEARSPSSGVRTSQWEFGVYREKAGLKSVEEILRCPPPPPLPQVGVGGSWEAHVWRGEHGVPEQWTSRPCTPVLCALGPKECP